MNSKERRVKLDKGKQRELVIEVVNKYGSLRELAVGFDIPYGTIKGYAREERLIPENFFKKIIKLLRLRKSSIDFNYLDSNWGAVLGGKKAMKVLEKKYPKKIIEWRKDAMKKARMKSPVSQEKKINIPKLDEKLAEFIGVYLGDGTLTKYQVKISGDQRYDLYHYEYLSRLVYELFGIGSSIRKEKNKNTQSLVISSKGLCTFLNKDFGLKYGHKIRNKTMIPEKIIKDKKLSMACFRGLVDTDGYIGRRGRGGSQFCIQFTSHNKLLLDQVHEIGKRFGIFTFKDNTGAGTNKWENIIKYFEIIGSSNLKHIVRFYEKCYHNNTIYVSELSDYFKQDLYKALSLPFRIGPVV